MGVNRFESDYSKIEGLVRIDPAEAEKQVAGLNAVKKERDNSEVTAALEELKQAAGGSENTMPAFIRCVEAYASAGEICDTLREVFGVQREFLIF